jgi:hypothetical protein
MQRELATPPTSELVVFQTVSQSVGLGVPSTLSKEVAQTASDARLGKRKRQHEHDELDSDSEQPAAHSSNDEHGSAGETKTAWPLWDPTSYVSPSGDRRPVFRPDNPTHTTTDIRQTNEPIDQRSLERARRRRRNRAKKLRNIPPAPQTYHRKAGDPFLARRTTRVRSVPLHQTANNGSSLDAATIGASGSESGLPPIGIRPYHTEPERGWTLSEIEASTMTVVDWTGR